MKNLIYDTKFFLQLYDVVTRQGEADKGFWHLNEIKAWHDFDGYTCWLSYKDLTITLLFHGGIGVEFDKKETLQEFRNKSAKLTSASSLR